MSKLYHLLGILFLIIGSNSVQAAAKKTASVGFQVPAARLAEAGSASKFQFKSYRQWKREKIQEATLKLNTTRSTLQSRKIAQTNGNSKTEASTPKDLRLGQLEAQMRLDLMSIEMAKDLTVTDYFVGYVNKIQAKKEFINEIAGKMSPEEVAELMTAYAQSIFGRNSLETPKSALKQVSKEATK